MHSRSQRLRRTFQTTLLRNIITDAPSTPGNLLLLSKKEIEEKLSGGGVFSRFENCRPLGPQDQVTKVVFWKLLKVTVTPIGETGTRGEGNRTRTVLLHDGKWSGGAANPLDVLLEEFLNDVPSMGLLDFVVSGNEYMSKCGKPEDRVNNVTH